MISTNALDNPIKQFDESMFVRAAEALASHIKNPTKDALLPSQFDKSVVDTVVGTLTNGAHEFYGLNYYDIS